MPRKQYYKKLEQALAALDRAYAAKRHEKAITSFTAGSVHKALIKGKQYLIFNSNDYLGLRFNPTLEDAEKKMTKRFGSGPGAVRFISGTHAIHKDLERAIARFHGREDAILFSSAFAANLGVLSVAAKNAPAENDVYVISDELNHRSIIDGIRLSGIERSQKAIFKHMDFDDLEARLKEGIGKFKRAIIVTDGVFSMLGEVQDLAHMRKIADAYDGKYPEGVLLIVDDCHGVGALGRRGRGAEEVHNTKADILVGTFGKALGSDGGYAVGLKPFIDLLRESASTYVYSNPAAPSTCGAALQGLTLVGGSEGSRLRKTLSENITYFKAKAHEAGLILATDSNHPIQPLLIGDTKKTKFIVDGLYKKGILVTAINYPVVPKGREEIRIQLTALHGKDEIDQLVHELKGIALR